MSSKLDQSLDEITGARRVNARRQRGGKARVSTGGVIKNTAQKPAKPAKAAAPAPRLPPPTGESKIIVSNLPSDVNEQQIKEYFTKSVGPVKKAMLTYNKTGRSIGVATIVFQKATSAAEAAKTFDGVNVDGRPMKVEVILGAQYAPTPAPPKSLGDRIVVPKKENTKAKAKPKAAGPKPATAGAAPAAGAKGKGRERKGRAGRPKPKTAEELDAEMSEYFAPGTATGEAPAPVNGGAAVATDSGDAAMIDESVM